jgi:hypothetical protein
MAISGWSTRFAPTPGRSTTGVMYECLEFGRRTDARSGQDHGVVGAWLLTSPAPQGPRRGVLPSVTQPFQPSDEEGLRAFLVGDPGVTAIRELLVTFVGPGRVWVIAHLEVDNNLRGDQVISLVRGIDSGLRDGSQYIYRVDIVPIGGAKAAP